MCTRGWPPWLLLVDMWVAYAKAVSEHAPQAQVLFDRFHLVQHLNRAVDEVRRTQMHRLSRKQKVRFKGVRYLLLKNPWNLTVDQKERLSTLVKSNTPITRAYYLKESFQLFFEYKQPKRAREHLLRVHLRVDDVRTLKEFLESPRVAEEKSLRFLLERHLRLIGVLIKIV